MRFNSSAAGSSFGSCGTSLPAKACFKIDWQGVFQDRLAEGSGALQSRFNTDFQFLNDRKLMVHGPDDGFLFGRGRERNRVGSKRFARQMIDTGSRECLFQLSVIGACGQNKREIMAGHPAARTDSMESLLDSDGFVLPIPYGTTPRLASLTND